MNGETVRTARFVLRPFVATDRAQLGYVDDPQWRRFLAPGFPNRDWNAGVALEACTALLDSAFTTTPLAKAVAHCEGENHRSRRVLEKLGMTLEGTLRQHRLNQQGRLVDELCFGLLKDEWPSLVGEGCGKSGVGFESGDEGHCDGS